MDFKEVKEYLETNKDSEEVKGYFGDFKKKYLESDEVKTKIAEIERLAIEKGRKRTPEEIEAEKKAYFEEFKKQYKVEEPKDPFMKKILEETEAMKKELETQKAIAKKEMLRGKVLPRMKGFEALTDLFIGEDEETTIKKVETFTELLTNFVQAEVNAKLKSGSYNPPNSNIKAAEEKGEGWFITAKPEEIREYMTSLTKK